MIPAAIVMLFSLVFPNGNPELAALAWGIEGEAAYAPGQYVGPISREAMVAIGCVIANRVADPYFPDSTLKVVTQPGQFGPARLVERVHSPAVNAAKTVNENPEVCAGGALFVYSGHDLDNLGWTWAKEEATQAFVADDWSLYTFEVYPLDLMSGP